MPLHRYPGHVLPVSDFTGETLGEGSDLLEWGTSAFSVMACKRPLYLQVSQRPHSIQSALLPLPPPAHCRSLMHARKRTAFESSAIKQEQA